MTMVSADRVRSAPAGRSGGWLHWIAGLAQALVDHWERRAAIKALSERDDRELRDIGIVRSQIEAAVGGSFNPRRLRMD